ncbi:MAG: GNAT family N-acetyltransferase [Pseudomonadales bacterium]|nr:GNAT family N-acetyltransferase [Pseudomonadales bacterium]MCP5359001.1 GNAT family N-acetyltransferase [Pseudomonadales bacterium]
MSVKGRQETCWQLNELAGESMSASRDRFEELVQEGILHQSGQAFSLALPAGRALDYIPYQWVQTRFDNFLYWDRAVVAQAHRRQGVGRSLFATLMADAADAGADLVVCAVHDRPHNRVGHAFVQALGFVAIESVMLPSRDIVTFYQCPVTQRSTAIATP